MTISAVRPAFARTWRRTRRGVGAAAVLALAASVAVMAAEPGRAGSATAEVAAGPPERGATAAADTAAGPDRQRPPADASPSPNPPGTQRTLQRIRQQRSAAEDRLAGLREFQKEARAVGLRADGPDERALAEALKDEIAVLRGLERELSRDGSAQRGTRDDDDKNDGDDRDGAQGAAAPDDGAAQAKKNGAGNNDAGKRRPGTKRPKADSGEDAAGKPKADKKVDKKPDKKAGRPDAKERHRNANNAKANNAKANKAKSAKKPAADSSPAKHHDGAKSRRAKAVTYARAQLGKPYRWGGQGPHAFDCSGLAMRAWQHAGVRIPRTTTAQWNTGKRISRTQLRPGDLVFRNGLGHVMIYVGGGRVIHSPHSGTTVQYAPLPPHGQVNGYVTVT